MEEKKDKKTFKELWANTRTRALIKLGMWFAFFFLIFMILGITSLFNRNNSSREEEKEEVVMANIPSMLENLTLSNYTFEYRINSSDKKYSYTGSKEGNEIKGYYESSNAIVKYIVKDNIYYELNNEELIENNTIITETDKNILDLNNMLNLIKEYEITNEVKHEKNIYTYDIINNEISYQVNITTKSSDIEKIIIDCNNINYELVFKNIESVTE